MRFFALGRGLRRAGAAAAGDAPQRQEELVLHSELVDNRGSGLLRLRVILVLRVEDFAAIVDKRLEDLLERYRIRAPCMVREPESDNGELFTGRWNDPLNELTARLLQCAEKFRRERERSAGAEGDAEKIATVYHEAQVEVHALWSRSLGRRNESASTSRSRSVNGARGVVLAGGTTRRTAPGVRRMADTRRTRDYPRVKRYPVFRTV